eukprot:5005974-Amphidinium_carterae.1
MQVCSSSQVRHVVSFFKHCLQKQGKRAPHNKLVKGIGQQTYDFGTKLAKSTKRNTVHIRCKKQNC